MQYSINTINTYDTLLGITVTTLEKVGIKLVPLFRDSNGLLVYSRTDMNYLTPLSLKQIETIVNSI